LSGVTGQPKLFGVKLVLMFYLSGFSIFLANGLLCFLRTPFANRNNFILTCAPAKQRTETIPTLVNKTCATHLHMLISRHVNNTFLVHSCACSLFLVYFVCLWCTYIHCEQTITVFICSPTFSCDMFTCKHVHLTIPIHLMIPCCIHGSIPKV
jgi:hypothetical protein